MLERSFQKNLIQELKERFPGCVVMKNDSSYIQGIPDLTVLYRDRWVVLELKRASGSSRRPNQSFYVEKLNEMSYAAGRRNRVASRSNARSSSACEVA